MERKSGSNPSFNSSAEQCNPEIATDMVERAGHRGHSIERAAPAGIRVDHQGGDRQERKDVQIPVGRIRGQNPNEP